MPIRGDTLFLVPTPGELALLEPRLRGRSPWIELCGFGPVAAAARTARLLAELRPGTVVVAGIAGAYDPEACPPGSVHELAWVALDGVGAGQGAGFLGPGELGIPQWSTPSFAITDRLELSVAPGNGAVGAVTVCAAAATPREASSRVARFPGAVLEEMEGFGVALACTLAGVPVRMVRGISNVAGDRDAARWSIPAAVAAVACRLAELLDESVAVRREDTAGP